MIDSKPITVFTPTFNRAFCLGQLYESLVVQTNQDFDWLIVDDGSTDDTKQLVESWIATNKISIRYIFQQNQGMHGGHNTAYDNIETELNVCIDSDDFMPPTAIERILFHWEKVRHKHLAGLIGLDAYKDGSIVGTKIPEDVTEANLWQLYREKGVTGDKKLVLRTAIVKKYPKYPLFENERFVPLHALYMRIDRDYDYACINEVLCIVEYLPDGSSRNIYKQYRRHPNGFRYSRILEMQQPAGLKYHFTRAMHFVSSSLFAKRFTISDSPRKGLTFLAIPFGLALHAFLLFKTRK
ncbi:glycosyltransferase family 2 protein [Flavobacterium sp.]|uniref:glycosyltransferase family 2 protein n=1 Tax=Flavobacterium sp. TaxID=239 RepID=UPI001206BFAF|nr:glycosyltransferase family 2 protein [Flavobacterium sp.]RZJ70841.1 MAG: glycosyltransferase family 2 protein [Flavobacterium sp.]